MYVKNCNRQTENRQRIKETTLVIGMDIGNEFFCDVPDEQRGRSSQ